MNALRKVSLFIIILFTQTGIIYLYAQEYKPLITSKPKLLQSSSLPDKTLFPKIDLFALPQAPLNIDSDKWENKIPELNIEQISFNSTYPRLIAPTLFIAYGIMAHENHMLKDLDKSTNNEVGEHFKNKMIYDDYLQFAPAVSVYALNLAGVKGNHDLKDVTIIMATSHLLMAGTVNILKNSTGVLRPDGSTRNSFPSGHTATSFVGAHILFREYIGKSPYIAFSGYIASSATGALRVLNKRHWVSDVLMGAGIGIFSVEASYLLLPTINKVLYPNHLNSKHTLAIAPNIGDNCYGIGMEYTF